MLSLKHVTLIAVTAAVFSLSSSSSANVTESSPSDDKNNTDVVIDGIPIKSLTDQEFQNLLDKEDNKLESELEIYLIKKMVEDRENGKQQQGASTNLKPREKRGIGDILPAIRAIFRGARRTRISRVGKRVTQQYIRRGNYNDATNHFYSLHPDDVKDISRRGLRGITGTVGNRRVTVRDRSTFGSPTLEIRTFKPDGEEFVRKIRYTAE